MFGCEEDLTLNFSSDLQPGLPSWKAPIKRFLVMEARSLDQWNLWAPGKNYSGGVKDFFGKINPI